MKNPVLFYADDCVKELLNSIPKGEKSKLINEAIYAYLDKTYGVNFYFKSKGIDPLKLDITNWMLANLHKFKYSLGFGSRLHVFSNDLEFEVDFVCEVDIEKEKIYFVTDKDMPDNLVWDYDKILNEIYFRNLYIQ